MAKVMTMYKIAKESYGSATFGDVIVDAADYIGGKAVKGSYNFLKWLTAPKKGILNPAKLIKIAPTLALASLIGYAGIKASETSKYPKGYKYEPGYFGTEIYSDNSGGNYYAQQ